MPSPDEILPAALALHNSPRRYALLLGSGLSRDTGIRTAVEITDDIIRQMAGDRIKRHQKPEDWYKETHGGVAPTFTGLFRELSTSGEDQEAALKPYFELKDNEGNFQKIGPTLAHEAIARLVKSGLISMIITTNFDPLLEEAIRNLGIYPLVITKETDERKMEVVGDQCRIVMINGKYPNTELKLTPDDLASYDPKLTIYLDRIFSEYGLLICGWSGIHDTGLVEILTTERIRRFAIFWCSRESPEKIPSGIRSKLHLSTIGIRSANEFFKDLELQIELLRRHERTTSLTVESAIKKIKDALRDPTPELILSDLLHEETDRVLTEVNRFDIVPRGPIEGKTCFKNRLEELERRATPLAAMVATLAYYDNGAFADLITETIDRLINLRKLDGDFLFDGQKVHDILPSELREYLNHLRLYPALLVIYSSGIAAVRRENFNNLSAILEKPQIKQFIGSEMSWKKFPFFESVNVWSVIWTVEQWTLDFSIERFGIRESPYYYPTRVIQNIVTPLIPSEIYFDESFDIFEYLLGLSYIRHSETKATAKSYPLLSRIILRQNGFFGAIVPRKIKLSDSLLTFLSDIGKKNERSEFFKGDSELFLRCVWKHGKIFQYNAPETDIPLPRGGFPGL